MASTPTQDAHALRTPAYVPVQLGAARPPSRACITSQWGPAPSLTPTPPLAQYLAPWKPGSSHAEYRHPSPRWPRHRQASQAPRCEPRRTSLSMLQPPLGAALELRQSLTELTLIECVCLPAGDRSPHLQDRTRAWHDLRRHLLPRGSIWSPPQQGPSRPLAVLAAPTDPIDSQKKKADEAYQVGKGLTPVAAYLAQDDIIKVRSSLRSVPLHSAYALLNTDRSRTWCDHDPPRIRILVRKRRVRQEGRSGRPALCRPSARGHRWPRRQDQGP